MASLAGVRLRAFVDLDVPAGAFGLWLCRSYLMGQCLEDQVEATDSVWGCVVCSVFQTAAVSSFEVLHVKYCCIFAVTLPQPSHGSPGRWGRADRVLV